MKNKITPIMLLLAVSALLLFSCSQKRNKPVNRENVILEAARLDSIRQETNLASKNIYDSIDYMLERHPTLASDYQNVTIGIKERTNEIIDYIQDLKIELITSVEGKGSMAISGKEINIAKIARIQNINVAQETLLGKDYDGKSLDLKALLKSYKNDLIKIADDPQITTSIGLLLNTDDQNNTMTGKGDAEVVKWEISVFQSQPLGSVILKLTQIQNDIKTAEKDVLIFIKNKIDTEIFSSGQNEIKN